MKRFNRLFVSACLVLAAVPALAQGQARVTFVDPDYFVDAGEYGLRRAMNLRTIQTHLERLGRDALATGQVLKIEVLDIDLAGTTWASTASDPIRIIRSGADRPSIRLRYVLETAGDVTTLRSGEETLSDIGFLERFATAGIGVSEPLRHEKRLLDRWFAARFDTAMPIKS